jgi:hypothetical protein
MHSLGLGALVVSALLHSNPSLGAPSPFVIAPSAPSESFAASSVRFSDASSVEGSEASSIEAADAIPALKRLAIPRAAPVKLTVVSPSDARVHSGDAVDPATHGFAKVEGATDRGVQITYRDIDLGQSTCATDPIERELRRVWTATDVAGNTGTSTQSITVMRRAASLDVRPGICPNEYKVGTGGSLAVSLVGRPDFDVRQIDTSTVELWTSNCTDGPIVPAQTKVEDNATPYMLADSGCHTSKKDGRADLALRFTSQQLAGDLHLKSYPKNATIKLIVTGRLTNGATFLASDSVLLK